jgi:signal peptidase I
MLWIVLFLIALTFVRAGVFLAENHADPPSTKLRVAGEAIESFTIAVALVFLVIRPFMLQAFYIPSPSMLPTLQVNDRILVNKLSYRFGGPQRHDIVVFRAPEAAIGEQGIPEEEQDFVKRVIGLPGDTVEIRDGVTYVNGLVQSEPYTREPPSYDMPLRIVPEGRLFVMGDNRNHSNDSHRWGTLECSRVLGKAVFVFWPPSRIGFLH